MKRSLDSIIRAHVDEIVASFDGLHRGNVYSLIVREVEKIVIDAVLKNTNYNLSRSAALLGISRSTLYRKMLEHGIGKM